MGLLGCKMLNKDSSVQYSFSDKFPSVSDVLKENPLFIKLKKLVNRNYKKSDLLKNHNFSHFVKWLGGAFLLCRSNIVEGQKEFFNTKFFMYSEDVEIAYRLNKIGFNHYFWAEKSITHLGGGSFPKENFKKSAQIILSNWLFIYEVKGKVYFLIYFNIVKLNHFLNGLIDAKHRYSIEYHKKSYLINFFKKNIKGETENKFLKFYT